MTTFLNERFTNQVMTVDGHDYTGCSFVGCTLVFEGGKPPVFTNCTFEAIKVQLKGTAAQTTNYLNVLYRSGLPQNVETVLSAVESGAPFRPVRPAPPPAINTGNHYGRLALYAVAFGLVFLWLFGMYLYGYIIGPNNALLNNPTEPLTSEVNFNQIPALPDTLAAEYDALKAAQLEQISTFGWIDQAAGIGRIPVEDAYQVLIAQQAASQ